MGSVCQPDVVSALRNSNKGRLKYDRTWHEDGRTPEILNGITKQLTTLSPKALDVAKTYDSSPKNEERPKQLPANGSQKNTRLLSKTVPRDTDAFQPSHYLICVSETELPIVEYEAERLKSSRQLVDSKHEEYEKFNQDLQYRVEQQYNIIKQKRQLEVLQQKNEELRIEQASMKELEENWKVSPEQMNSQFADLRSAPSEAELRAKKEVERKKKEQEELKLQLESMNNSLLYNLVPKIKEKIEFCEHENYANLPYTEWKSHVDNFLLVFQSIAQNVVSTGLTSNELEKCQSILKHAESMLQDISAAVANKQMERELENRNRTISSSFNTVNSHSRSPSYNSQGVATFGNSKRVNQDASSDVQDTVTNDTGSSAVVEEVDAMEDEECNIVHDGEISSSTQAVRDAKKALVSHCTDVSAYRSYCSITKSLRELNKSLESFRSDPQQKKYRLMLHKAVAINTISDASGSQLREKVHQLVCLLSGQMVECGGKYTSVKEHPLAQSYCTNLLAEKLVTQGEEQIASRIAAAFPFACVAVTICSKFPDLKELILGHFYIKCPYLVPYYPLKEDSQSDESYYLALGYKFIDGKVEERTNFLKRMHGYMALYAAMIQCDSAMGYPHQSLFTLEDGWKWIARTLNVDPRPDVTATVLLVFLEVAGHAMLRAYDKQFKKVLHTLCKDYFPKIKQITPPNSGGPVGRLHEFLHIAIKKGYISPPEGIIGPHFWRT